MSALIETRALTRMDERRQVPLLQPTDFILNAADRVSITGSSGSGKSVFLRALAPAGRAQFRANPVERPTDQQRRDSPLPLPCQLPVPAPGVARRHGGSNLRFPFSLKTSRNRSFDLGAVTTLLGHAGKAADFLSKNAADLSGGESQVVSLIRTLQLNPEVLLLDEPTAALDPPRPRKVEALIDAWSAPTSPCLHLGFPLSRPGAAHEQHPPAHERGRSERSHPAMNYQNLTALDLGIAASLILINGALSLLLRLGLGCQLLGRQCAPWCNCWPSVICWAGCSSSPTGTWCCR